MKTIAIGLTFAAGLILGAAAGPAAAHCDTMDGPVVMAAQKALDSGNLNPVLAWVKPAGEAEVKAAFARTMKVRALGPEARDLADRWFFETVVRVHRAGEGAPYTGLKDAADPDPALEAADRAVESGKLAPVTKLVNTSVEAGLKDRFAKLRALKAPGDDVAAGREWVEAYVKFIHYVERAAKLASATEDEHGTEGDDDEAHLD